MKMNELKIRRYQRNITVDTSSAEDKYFSIITVLSR